MNRELQMELESAIRSDKALEEIVSLLRRCKQQGVTQHDAYTFLEKLHQDATDQAIDDRILEVADFVAGFCAPHMKIWDTRTENLSR